VSGELCAGLHPPGGEDASINAAAPGTSRQRQRSVQVGAGSEGSRIFHAASFGR
jgi:hypothetical protein